MKIACLAWGSLLWKPGALPLDSAWRAGGPPLPLEFTRVGDHGELSPALCVGVARQPTWWALLAVADLPAARERLRERERIDPDRPEWIGSLPGDPQQLFAVDIEAWRVEAGIDAVVWTALPPRHQGEEGRMPTAEEAVAYLAGLEGKRRAHARDYIERMPPEFATPHRDAIEARLGWKPRAVPA